MDPDAAARPGRYASTLLGRSSVLSAPVQRTREAESEAKRTQGITPALI
jgi:hypothetical protein